MLNIVNKQYWQNLDFIETEINFEEKLFYWSKISFSSSLVLISLLFPKKMKLSIIKFAFENCGVSFIKLGQWIAMRKDIFPEDLCCVLSNLQKNAPGHSINYSLKMVDSNIKLEESLGSGSVAQVYRGKMNDRRVVVKILHPNIKEKIKKEVKIIEQLINFVDNFGFFKSYNLKSQFEEFVINFIAQCDLKNEERNLKILRKIHNEDVVKIPKTFYSSENVLVEEYVECHSLNEYNESMANKFINFLAKMLLKDRFLHVDLHGGNLLIEKETKKIVLLDAGMCKLLNKRNQENFQDLISAVLFYKSGSAVGNLLIERLPKNVKNVKTKKEFIKECDDLCKKYLFKPNDKKHHNFFTKINFVSKISKDEGNKLNFNFSNLGKFISESHKLLRKHSVLLDSNYSDILTSLICFDGLAQPLYKYLDNNEVTQTFLKEAPLLRFTWMDFKRRIKELFV